MSDMYSTPNIENQMEDGSKTPESHSTMAWNHETSHAETCALSESEHFPVDIASNEHLKSCDSPDNILARLNDDCIIHIFEYLQLSDLCYVVVACKRFESCALSVFKRKYIDIDLNELIQDQSEDENLNWSTISGNSECDCEKCYNVPTGDDPILPMNMVENMIRHFGPYIQTIRIFADDEVEGNEILDLLVKHCTDLNKLIMTDVAVSEYLMAGFGPLFDHLKFLEVTNSPFHIGSDLTELFLEDVYLDFVLTRRLEKLQALFLFNVDETRPGALKSLLASPPHLKILNISGVILPNLLKDQSSLTPELEELIIVDAKIEIGDMQHVNNMAKMANLKSFSFDCHGFSLLEVLNNFVEHNVPIEELYLINLTISTNAATNLIELSKLRKLQLSDGGWAIDVDFAKLVKGMSNLEELYLCDFGLVTVEDIKAIIANAPKLNTFQLNYHQQEDMKIIVDTIDFNEMCRDIAKRSVGSKLHLNICGNHCKLNVSGRIIERNRPLLEVQIITYNEDQSMDIMDYYSEDDDEDSPSEDDSN